MSFTSLLRHLNRGPRQHSGSGRKSSRTSRFVPQLEILEDRTVLSELMVLNNLDKGAGSLRDAIAQADYADTIVFDPGLDGQTITLTSDALTIARSLSIQGPGAELLAVSGNDSNRVFVIEKGVTVTIAGLTITHGRAVGSNGGGGILNMGSALILDNMIFSNNRQIGSNADRRSLGGGGIYNRDGGVLAVSAGKFIENQSIGRGGSFGEGGAIWNQASALIIDSTFTGNRAAGGDGGRVTGAANIVGSANGGAIFN